jgi:hypothetical protein
MPKAKGFLVSISISRQYLIKCGRRHLRNKCSTGSPMGVQFPIPVRRSIRFFLASRPLITGQVLGTVYRVISAHRKVWIRLNLYQFKKTGTIGHTPYGFSQDRDSDISHLPLLWPDSLVYFPAPGGVETKVCVPNGAVPVPVTCACVHY